jgi:ribose-phosphate pyrophosphokinase
VSYTGAMTILCGSASSALTKGICDHLSSKVGSVLVDRFADGEVRIQIIENIRGRDVFIVNSTSPPANDHLIELLVLIDAAKRASAARVTAVLPYFGYARQDRKDKPRVPITAKLVSNLIVAAGADRVLTVDLHCGQIQGFFDIPLDHLNSDVVFVRDLQKRGLDSIVAVAPDTGSANRAREIASRLQAPLALVDKRRPTENVAEVMNVVGDVKGKHALMFDDMVDTGGTLVKAAAALKERGAADVRACCTHPILSGDAVERISESALTELVVSDTIPLSEKATTCPKIRVLSLAPLIAEAVRRIHEDESISILFK